MFKYYSILPKFIIARIFIRIILETYKKFLKKVEKQAKWDKKYQINKKKHNFTQKIQKLKNVPIQSLQ